MIVDALIDPFLHYPFMARALAACVILAIGATPLGIFMTLRRMTLYKGVYPIPFDATNIDRRALNHAAITELEQRDILRKGDLVILTKGDLIGIHGKTNSLKIVTVGDIPNHLKAS